MKVTKKFRTVVFFLVALLLINGLFSMTQQIQASTGKKTTISAKELTLVYGKSKAQQLGWSGGSLLSYASDKCIGGDIYSNYEKTLPVKDGRVYYECDINTLGALERGAERLVYSNDGFIFYTADHYATFEKLYE